MPVRVFLEFGLAIFEIEISTKVSLLDNLRYPGAFRFASSSLGPHISLKTSLEDSSFSTRPLDSEEINLFVLVHFVEGRLWEAQNQKTKPKMEDDDP